LGGDHFIVADRECREGEQCRGRLHLACDGGQKGE
jgi:hypothetical protein